MESKRKSLNNQNAIGRKFDDRSYVRWK